MSIAFPASADIDERPLALLYACHDKVRHFSALIGQLAPHVAHRGVDAEAQQAASNVLRYFELALPNHHADEEEDIFPALRTLCDPTLNAALDAVLAEHVALDALWQRIRPWLNQIAQGAAPPASPDISPDVLQQFVQAYPAHAAHEEREIFTAIDRLPIAEVERISRCMRQRRGARV